MTSVIDRLVEGILAKGTADDSNGEVLSIKEELRNIVDDASKAWKVSGKQADEMKEQLIARLERVAKLKLAVVLKTASGEDTHIENMALTSSIQSIRATGAVAAVTVIDRLLNAVVGNLIRVASAGLLRA